MKQEIIDLGDASVECDDCSTRYAKGSPQAGGILFESKAICPVCAPKWEDRAQQYGEQRFIHDRAREGETFYDFVMRCRGGDNTAQFITFDNADEALAYMLGGKGS